MMQVLSGWLVLWVTAGGLLVHAVNEGTYDLTIKHYCPYFKNRGPSKQEDLKNCTWYRENSCCTNSEVEFAFSQLNGIPGASEECSRTLNYLYCYICAPDQSSFFKRSTLIVCEELCDQIYDACRNALLKGMQIQQLYANGKQFCQGRRFQTAKKSEGSCFYYDPNNRATKSGCLRVTQSTLSILTGLVFTVLNTLIQF